MANPTDILCWRNLFGEWEITNVYNYEREVPNPNEVARLSADLSFSDCANILRSLTPDKLTIIQL